MNSHLIFLAVVVLAAVQPVPALAQSEDGGEENVRPQIEQLAVGNYWTVRGKAYGPDGELDQEDFSSVVVLEKQEIAGRECFKLKQFKHDRPRISLSEAKIDRENDYIYWEFLDNGNLYYFDRPEIEEVDKREITEEDPSEVTVFSADSPAFYLKYPAEQGDLFENFETVGSVVATDRRIKTPAGEFICYVYGFVTDTRREIPQKSYTLEYWCPGIGFVKLEEYEVSGADQTLVYEMELLAYHLEDDDQNLEDIDPDEERRNKIENVR